MLAGKNWADMEKKSLSANGPFFVGGIISEGIVFAECVLVEDGFIKHVGSHEHEGIANTVEMELEPSICKIES